MFGYLTMQRRFMTWQTTRAYRNYYCGICFGLQYGYGQLSRFLLSYDIALLGILMRCHQKPLKECYHCHGDKKEKACIFSKDKWNQMAAINLLLVNEKLKDDINDDHSVKARLVQLVLAKKMQKAQQTYPKMAKAIATGYQEIYKLEKKNSQVREIEECFADMMEHTLSSCISLKEWERMYLRAISRWIYYIDALEDYETDWKEGTFNPLKKADAPTFYEYLRRYMETVCEDIQYLYEPIMRTLEIMPKNTVEDRLLVSMLRDNIPYTTSRILSGKRLWKIKIGSVWEELEEIKRKKR